MKNKFWITPKEIECVDMSKPIKDLKGIVDFTKNKTNTIRVDFEDKNSVSLYKIT